MNKKLQLRILIILAVLAVSVYFAFPLEKRINLGLDLKGGMHLVLNVDLEKLPEEAKKDAVVRAIEILRNRIDSLGAGETVIQRQGENQIIIQLPGITDREKALHIIGTVAQLEFSLVNDAPEMLKQALDGNIPDGYTLKKVKDKNMPILVETKASMKGEAIKDARVEIDSTGFSGSYISLTFSAKGAKEFADLTRKNVGRQLAIVLDDVVQSYPNINEAILDGHAQITGQFTFDEASLLALSLRSGSLPAPMHVEEERTIGPLLGKDSIDAGIKSAIIGLALVLAFMIIYYLFAGLVSVIALMFNLVLVLGTLGLLNASVGGSAVTLTLPGIAGIILTLGMAVDANVLINERIREELELGKQLSTAIANGYARALRAIVDSNVTSIIAAVMLFQFGSGPIKGFAITLTLGLVASMFTALYVTRTIMMIFLHFNWIKSLPMLRIFSNTKFDFIRIRYFCFILSLVVTLGGLIALNAKKESAYGIDFAGGQIQEYHFEKPITSETIREILKTADVKEAVIQRLDQTPQNVIIRTSDDTFNVVEKALNENLKDNPNKLMRIEKVGPIVGKHLRQQAFLAIIYAMGGMLLYIAYRFRHWDFAIAAVIALLHDVLVGLGLLVFFGYQIDLLIVTALLTIAGYSINDTIIVYDRIRENMGKAKRYDLREIINLSINQTLARTILTSLTVFLVVIPLFMYGGEVLHAFSLCLLIGFATGVYSSIYVAAPLVLFWEKRKK
ncbi:MAG: protein translocase subunit SecD [Candidatus Omnitrophica bacterium]|nr:protein translocase subunit SecD [Candidatus Omnitrophota bacterium]